MKQFEYPAEVIQFAEMMVTHPQFRPFMGLVKAQAVTDLLGTKPNESEQRELIYRQIKAYDDLDAAIRAVAASPKFVEDNTHGT